MSAEGEIETAGGDPIVGTGRSLAALAMRARIVRADKSLACQARPRGTDMASGVVSCRGPLGLPLRPVVSPCPKLPGERARNPAHDTHLLISPHLAAMQLSLCAWSEPLDMAAIRFGSFRMMGFRGMAAMRAALGERAFQVGRDVSWLDAATCAFPGRCSRQVGEHISNLESTGDPQLWRGLSLPFWVRDSLELARRLHRVSASRDTMECHVLGVATKKRMQKYNCTFLGKG